LRLDVLHNRLDQYHSGPSACSRAKINAAKSGEIPATAVNAPTLAPATPRTDPNAFNNALRFAGPIPGIESNLEVTFPRSLRW
jgi:hypothetical protein